MPDSFISVNSNKPGAASETLLYTAPGTLNYTLVLSLVCANQSAGADSVTIRKLRDGEVAGVADRELTAALNVPANESLFFKEKVVLGANESISVESSGGNVVFTLSLLESTP